MKSFRGFDRFKYNGLFVKMFLIMVISIIAVAITTTWTTIRVSERVFLDTFSITNTKIIQQINSSLDSFNTAIVQANIHVAQSGSIKGFLSEESGDSSSNFRAQYRMGEYMKRIVYALDAYDVEVLVTGINGRSYTSSGSSLLQESYPNFAESRLNYLALQNPGKLLYLYTELGKGMVKTPGLVATKALIDPNSGANYGVVYITILEKDFSRFYETYTSAGNEVAMVSEDGQIVSSDRLDWIGREEGELLAYAKELHEEARAYMNVTFDGQERILLSQYIDSLGLYVVNLIDKEQAIGQLTDMKAIVLSILMVVGIALIIVFVISRRLTKSLTRLVKQIATISKYEFDHQVTVGGSYETRQLAQAFNAMLAELQDYVRRLVQTEKEKRGAELEALQGQINPHFLYNTLASVKFMVQQGSKEKAAETIHALISLLQNVIGNASETIPLSQELVNMKNYVLINHVRYGERIRMHYFIAPDCMGYHVPKLIIQPFIENAFFHGFNRKSEGNIYFMAAVEGESLLCEVMDDGDGFDMQIKAKDKERQAPFKRQLFTGIGVKNVDDRLKLLYGESYGVFLTSEPAEGTKVKIRLPLIQDEA